MRTILLVASLNETKAQMMQNEPVLHGVTLRCALFTVVHAGLTMTLMVYSFSAGMKAFDDLAYHQPPAAVAAAALAEVLMLPLTSLWSRWASSHLPNVIELLFFGLNSVIWGVIFGILSTRFPGPRTPQTQAVPRYVTTVAGAALVVIALLAALAALRTDDAVTVEVNGYDPARSTARTVATISACSSAPVASSCCESA